MEPERPEETLTHWRAFWSHSWLLGLAVAFSVLVAVLSLTMPLFMLLVYDRVLTARSQETLWALVLLALTLIIGMGLLDYARRRVLARFAGKLQETLEPHLVRTRAGDRLGQDGPATAELDALRSFAHSGGMLTLIDVVWIPLFVGTIYLISPELGALTLTGCGLIVIVQGMGRWAAGYRWKEARAARKASSQVAGIVKRGYRGLPELAIGQAMTDRYLMVRGQSRTAAIRASDLAVAFESTASTVRNLCSLMGLAIGASLVLANQLTIGGLVACLVLLSRVFGPFSAFLQVIPGLREAAANWQRLGEVLAQRAGGQDLGLPDPAGDAALVLRQVSVAGDIEGAPVLNGLDLTVRPGRVTEIVGPSASGKSLLAEVLALVRPVAGGNVLVFGTRAALLAPDALRQAAALVPDVPRFFAGTLAENIAGLPGDQDTAPQVEAAARAAELHATVQTLPKGYGTRIAQDGAPLPRGLRDQTGLARALYLRPRVLVIDEPSDTLRGLFGREDAAAVAEFLADGRALVVLSRGFLDLAERADQYILSGGRLIPRGTGGAELLAFQKQGRTTP
jgi:ABC-type protease/lipase transport system fused ATPase/permease subunit